MTKYYIVFFIALFGSLFAKKAPVQTFSEVTLYNGRTFELLGGSQEELAQINSFPLEKYKIYDVDTLGSFYIDYTHDTIKGTLSNGKVWEPNIVALIKRYATEGTVAVDMGSHIGTHLVTMSQAVGKEGYVVGFEPQIKLFSELVMNMQLNQCQNVFAYRAAGGREFGQVQMNVAHTSNEGGTAIGKGGDNASLIPLDAMHLSPVSLIKINVEGYEDEILYGATETIQKNRPYIILELMEGTQELDNKRDATITHLQKMNYKVVKLGGWDWFAIPKK